MNYIYDILLNFKEEMYDFYDWNKNDNIIHIRKIPIIKIKTNDLLNIVNNKVIFDYIFLEKIKNKTEAFTPKNIKKIENCCLLTDGNLVVAILVQNKKIKKSSLLVDEEIDTLEEISFIKNDEISYKIITSQERKLKTRKQKEIENFILKEINKIKNETEKLKYIYYECFNVKEDKIEKIISKIKDSIDDISISKKIYKFFKMIEVHR